MCGTSAETVSVTSDPGVWEGGRLRVSPTRVGAARGVWVRRVACGCGVWVPSGARRQGQTCKTHAEKPTFCVL